MASTSYRLGRKVSVEIEADAHARRRPARRYGPAMGGARRGTEREDRGRDGGHLPVPMDAGVRGGGERGREERREQRAIGAAPHGRERDQRGEDGRGKQHE